MSGLDQNQIVSSNWYSFWAYTCITAMFIWQRDLRVHVHDTYTLYSGIIRTAIENLALSLTSTEYTLHSPSMCTSMLHGYVHPGLQRVEERVLVIDIAAAISSHFF